MHFEYDDDRDDDRGDDSEDPLSTGNTDRSTDNDNEDAVPDYTYHQVPDVPDADREAELARRKACLSLFYARGGIIMTIGIIMTTRGFGMYQG